MKLDFAFVCDYAEAAGKLYALGIGFDMIYAPTMPFRHPHFSIVVQMRASTVEAGQKAVLVHLIDEDGKQVVPPLNASVHIPKPDSVAESVGRFVIEFGNVEFKRYGAHSVHIAVDSLEIATISFTVARPPTTVTRPPTGSR